MKLTLSENPATLLRDPPEALAEKAWRELATWAGRSDLPVFTTANLSVRLRLIHEIPADTLEHVGRLPFPGPPVSTLAWYLAHVLEGLLWESAGQVAELHVRREWGRIAAVEVTV